MTDTDDRAHDDLLEAYFEDARASPPVLSEAAMARILSDAAAMQPRDGRKRWRDLMRLPGDAPALAGLVAATCVGLWIGVAPPEALPDLGGMMLGQNDVALDRDVYAFGWILDEG